MASKRAFGRMLGAVLCALAGLLAFTPQPASAASYRYFNSVSASMFRLSPGAGDIVKDSIVLWSTGAATTYVYNAEPTVRFQFIAEAEQCAGRPRLEVAIDDHTYMGREIAGTGNYAIPGQWALGLHKITLRFKNDFLSATCDRNLKLGGFYFSGVWPNGSVGPIPTYQLAKGAYATISPPSAGTLERGPTSQWRAIRPVLWSPGAANYELDSQGANLFSMLLRPTPCEGNPSYRVSIDGVVVSDGVVPVPDVETGLSYVPMTGSWINGLHQISISMYDDKTTSVCDRSLAMEEVQFHGRV